MRTALGRAIAWGVVLAVLFVLLWGPSAALLTGVRQGVLTPAEQVSAVEGVRAQLAQLATGALALAALIFTGRGFYLQREAQMTDRYIRAVQLLGSDELEVRVGAIYALERIMVDSPRDHATIVEVLAAFARQRAPADPDAWANADAPPMLAEKPLLPYPGTDVRAAVTVLGRRPAGRAERGVVDLGVTDLGGIDLYRANLATARLHLANLTYAFLIETDLSNAHLNRANLDGAYLAEVCFRGADLSGASLRNAQLQKDEVFDYTALPVIPDERVTSGCDLERACLKDADLRGADLRGVRLAHAVLVRADLRGADLRGAILTGADLTGAKLDLARLDGALGLRLDPS